jgi:hypothetical protein
LSVETEPKGIAACWSYGIAIVGAFLIVAALACIMHKATAPAPLGEDRVKVRRDALKDLRASNAEVLNNYGWQDPAKGLVRLPISQAMTMFEQQWRANPAAARSNLMARADVAAAPPPKVPEKPSVFE